MFISKRKLQRSSITFKVTPILRSNYHEITEFLLCCHFAFTGQLKYLQIIDPFLVMSLYIEIPLF